MIKVSGMKDNVDHLLNQIPKINQIKWIDTGLKTILGWFWILAIRARTIQQLTFIL